MPSIWAIICNYLALKGYNLHLQQHNAKNDQVSAIQNSRYLIILNLFMFSFRYMLELYLVQVLKHPIRPSCQHIINKQDITLLASYVDTWSWTWPMYSPSLRLYLHCMPKTEIVPTPVRSPFLMPRSMICWRASKYCISSCLWVGKMQIYVSEWLIINILV